MKANKLFNQLVATTSFSALLVVGLPKTAFGAAELISVCKESDAALTKLIVHTNHNGKLVTYKRSYSNSNDYINRSQVENDLKWQGSTAKYRFSRDEASSIKGELPSPNKKIKDLSLCDSAAPPSITLKGTVRDFQASHPDFEFGFLDRGGDTGSDKNIVTTELGADGKPVFNSSYSGTTASTAENFSQWYNDVDGVNLRKTLDLELIRDPATGMYVYENDAFFPINDELFGNIENDPDINHNWGSNSFKDRNYHFTYEAHQRFTYKGGEVFTFSGDDDVWVYINGKRIIDIGGVHAEESQTVNIDDIAASAGIQIGGTYDFDFFFAERNYSGSNFKITTSMELEENKNVSLELVLSVDVSTSVDAAEYGTQVDGYIAALRDSEVQDAIKALPEGMAINMQFWGEKGQNGQSDVADVGWFKLIKNGDSIDGLDDFISALESPNTTRTIAGNLSESTMLVNGKSHRIRGGTDIRIAIEEAASLLLTNDYQGDRLVIDVSGDGIPKDTPYPEAKPTWEYGYLTGKCGYTLNCPPVVSTRDAVIQKGITINGLPIIGETTPATGDNWRNIIPGVTKMEDRVDDYYRTQVIGGTDSFSISVDGFNSFAEAVKLKMKKEISPNSSCNSAEGCSRRNNAPEAQDDKYKVVPREQISLDVASNDLDADGDSLTITDFYIMSDSGTLEIVNNQLAYTAPDTPGDYTFMYQVDDGKGGVDKASVTIEVAPYSD